MLPARIIAVLFALLGLNAGAQVVLSLFGRNSDPDALTAMQAVIAATGFLAAIGAWRVARWAPAAAVAYGVAAGGMLLVLGPLLELDAASTRGIRLGAAIVFLFSAAAAWYLHRLHRTRADPQQSVR